MNFKMYKLTAVLLVIFILCISTLIVSTAASDYDGHWANTEIGRWTSMGVINGYEDGTFRPDRPISRAEFAAITDRLFKFVDKSPVPFTDVSANSWYSEAVSRAAAANLIKGDGNGTFRPQDNITRQEAVVILARAFELKTRNENAVNNFIDRVEVAAWAKSAVSALFERQYIKGRTQDHFFPKDNITRAEVVKLLDNIVKEVKNERGEYTGTVEGTLLVNTQDVLLKNMTINGDLVLANGIGNGNVRLEGVVVKGNIVVKGGGENSVVLSNTRVSGSLIVVKIDGKIRIVAQGDSSILNVELRSGARLEEDGTSSGEGFGTVEIIEIQPGQQIQLDGNFEAVDVEADDVKVQILDGEVKEMNIKARAEIQVISGKVDKLIVEGTAGGTKVNVESTAVIGTFTANSAVAVSGAGKIDTANINVANVTIETKPANLNVASGITASVGGKTVTGTDTPPPPSPGGDGDGGPSTPNAAITNVLIIDDNSNATASYSNGIVAVTVQNPNADTSISGVTISAAGAASLKLKSIGNVNLTRTFDFVNGTVTIYLQDILAGFTDKTSVSIQTLASVLGNPAVIKGDLIAGPGYNTRTNAIFTIQFPDNITIIDIGSYISVEKGDDSSITVTIKDGSLNMGTTGIAAVLAIVLGEADQLNGQVKIAGDNWLDISDINAIKAGVKTLTGKSSGSEITLGDLSGKTIYYRKSTGGTVYSIHFD